ncbi:MAG: hypothetical protein PHC50_04075 [Candidatus Cloacimonetes bacterium]|nr:hypothetical protein [Candidatus Cloacimonadota bacterium]
MKKEIVYKLTILPTSVKWLAMVQVLRNELDDLMLTRESKQRI